MSLSQSENAEELISTVDLSESERHRLLADKRRRLVLDALVDVGTPSTLTEVATEVAARERAGTERPDSDPSDVRITLHHVHLPLLADLEILDYNAEDQRVDVGRRGVGPLVE